MEKINLFGPFVGEFKWEMFYFAPHLIHLKKQNEFKSIVFTRKERFDLYGDYADILIPLDINEIGMTQDCFSLNGLTHENYKLLCKIIYRKYNRKYKIENHYYPYVHKFYKDIKWQFSRNQMDYSFKPRFTNIEIVNNLNIRSKNIFLDFSSFNDDDKSKLLNELINFTNNDEYSLTVYDEKFPDEFKEKFENLILINDIKVDNLKSTIFGCVISIINRSLVSIGNLNNLYSHLSVLIKVPLISIYEIKSDDDIRLLNPNKTKIISFNNLNNISDIVTGNLYENNL